MASDSVAEILLRFAWGQLWKPGTPYYLPDAIANGASGAGVVVPPLAARPVPDLGPYNLFSSDPWGSVSISLVDNTLDGLRTAADGGFRYDEATRTYTAVVRFGALDFSGRYKLFGGGLDGCAIACVSGLLHAVPAVGAARADEAAAGAGGDEPPTPEQDRIALAQEYRGKLVTSDNGLDLVARYYDNNETMNEIAAGQNIFSKNFATRPTSAAGRTVNSVDLANVTTAAAVNPSDPDEKVGDALYRMHAYQMQILFAKACDTAYRATGDTKYTDAGRASTSFATLVTNHPRQDALTVDEVMDTVRSADDRPTQALLHRRPGEAAVDGEDLGVRAPAEASEEYRLATELAQEAIDEWEASGWQSLFSWEVAERAALATGVPIGYGTFGDRLTGPSVTLGGRVDYAGEPTKLTLTITVDSVAADLPEIDILLDGDPGTLYDRVVNELANAVFVKDLVRRKLETVLNAPSVRTYLEERVNQSISQALGAY